MRLLEKYGIFLVTLLAFGLRIININQSFWLDEAISALAAKKYSFAELISVFINGDNHPPLFYLILRGWGLLFGFSDMGLRFLPIIAGTLTVGVCYLFLKKLFNWWIALLGASLMATSPLHIYYSQEVRMYPLLGLWAIVLMYLFIGIIKDQKKLDYVLFSLGLVILVATDYVGLFLIPVFFIIAWIAKTRLKNIFMAFIPLGIAGLFWLPTLLQQKETALRQLSGLPGWRELAGGTPKEIVVLWMKLVLGRISFFPKESYYLLVGIFSLPLIAAFSKTIGKKGYFLWIFLLIPLIGSMMTSFLVPSFNYFRFIYVLPAFYGLVAFGIHSFSKKLKYVLIGTVFLGNVTGLFFYYADPQNQREQWKQSIAYIEQELPNLVLFDFPEPFAPFYWYSSGQVKGVGGLTGLSSQIEQTRTKLSQEIPGDSHHIIYVSYLRDLTDSSKHIQSILDEQQFRQTKSVSFPGVGEVITYEK